MVHYIGQCMPTAGTGRGGVGGVVPGDLLLLQIMRIARVCERATLLAMATNVGLLQLTLTSRRRSSANHFMLDDNIKITHTTLFTNLVVQNREKTNT